MTIYKEGDTVTVEMIVTKYHDSNKHSAMINVRYCEHFMLVRESDIKSHNPRTIQVSDMVKIRPDYRECPATYKVLAVDGDEAWIKPFPNGGRGSRFTIYTKYLERI